MYTIKKQGSYYVVLCGSVIVYRHSTKRFAVEWLQENELQPVDKVVD